MAVLCWDGDSQHSKDYHYYHRYYCASLPLLHPPAMLTSIYHCFSLCVSSFFFCCCAGGCVTHSWVLLITSLITGWKVTSDACYFYLFFSFLYRISVVFLFSSNFLALFFFVVLFFR